MISPGWVTAAIAVYGVVFAWAGAWYVARDRQRRTEKDVEAYRKESFEARKEDRAAAADARKEDRAAASAQIAAVTTALNELSKAVKDIGTEIKTYLFNPNDGGRAFYMRAVYCGEKHRECRKEMGERLSALEDKQ